MVAPERLFVTAVTNKATIDDADGYPWSIPAIRNLITLRFESPVTFFVGENGSGKSTLLEAIAGAYHLNLEGGAKWGRFSTRATHSDLHRHLKLTKSKPPATDAFFLRAESFYNLATAADKIGGYLFDAEAHGSLHDQSHGEAFLSLVTLRLRGNGFYLFDEPEAALSPSRQLALMAAMHRLITHQSQFIIATHSPILLGYPGARILHFGDGAPEPIAYEDTEHFQVTRAFLANPERMLKELLRED